MIHQRSTNRNSPHQTTESIRASLFSSSPDYQNTNPNPMSSLNNLSSRPGQTNGNRSALVNRETSESLFEDQNDALAAQLSERVGLLKSISIQIGEEAKITNKLADDMMTDMDSAGTMLKGTLGKLGNMMSKGGSSHMCYLVLFICFIFFVVYFLKR